MTTDHSQRYRQRIERGLTAYADATGREVDPRHLDPRREHVTELYRLFVRNLALTSLGGNDGEWAALRMGIKPMVREVVMPETWQRMRSQFEAEGLHTLVLQHEVDQDRVDGFLSVVTDSETAAHDPGCGCGDPGLRSRTARPPNLIAYVGRDCAAIRRAVETETRQLETRSSQEALEATAAHGLLLGYPPCCVEAFRQVSQSGSNPIAVAAARARTRRPDVLLNNLSLGFFHLVGWVPCSYDCKAAREYASQVHGFFHHHQPELLPAAMAVLAMPRIYIDDRRQIVFDGRLVSESEVEYRTVYTPYALDRDTGAVEYEWIFFVDLASRFLAGSRARIRDDLIEVSDSRGAIVDQIERTADMLWFPFASHSRNLVRRSG